jgi:hypothetical protein
MVAAAPLQYAVPLHTVTLAVVPGAEDENAAGTAMLKAEGESRVGVTAPKLPSVTVVALVKLLPGRTMLIGGAWTFVFALV